LVHVIKAALSGSELRDAAQLDDGLLGEAAV
jgi:hypothetical protein